MLPLATAVHRLPLVLGTNPFGWTADETTSSAILDAFVEAGGTMIDTADGYSHWAPGNTGGEAEHIIGRWLAARGTRDEVIIATKVARHPQFVGLSPEVVAAAARASLERLQIETIDIYYAHYDDPDVPLDETVAAFDQLIDDGIIRHVALSNYTADRVTAWVEIARDHGYRMPVAIQPHYNLLRRVAEEHLLPAARRNGLAIIPYFGLASGLLTGKYATAAEARASHRASFLEQYLTERSFAVVERVRSIAAAREVTPAAVALAWLRQQHGVLAPLTSASTVEQISALLDTAAFELSDDDLAELTEISTVIESTDD